MSCASAPATTRSLLVAVVDVDEVSRAGYRAILEEHPRIGAVEAMDHDEALRRGGWNEVDIVLIDPVDVRRPHDQVPGAAVVAAIRDQTRPDRPSVIVVASNPPCDAVRRRMKEAGANALFHRAQIREADRLHRAVLDPQPDDDVPDPVDLEAMHRLGITSRSRVNAGVVAAFEQQLVPGSGWVGPRGRDRFARRARFNEQALLQPVGVDGVAPDRPQTVPSLTQIQRFVTWATHVVPLVEPGTDR